MVKAETQRKPENVTFEWMRIASELAQGLLAPEEAVSLLQALAEVHPVESAWLQEEIETIRFQFGLDVAARILNGEGSYWEQLLSVLEALLDERIEHGRALELLALVDAQFPGQAEQTATLMTDIEESPLRHFLETDY